MFFFVFSTFSCTDICISTFLEKNYDRLYNYFSYIAKIYFYWSISQQIPWVISVPCKIYLSSSFFIVVSITLDKAVTNLELAVTYNLNVCTLLYMLKHWQGVQLKIRWYNFFLINICKAERLIICLIFYIIYLIKK